MPNDSLTEIVCVIDKSGSMQQVLDDAIGGFNAFLAEQERAPGEARLTLVLFAKNPEILCDGVAVAEAPRLSEENYIPRGTTALFDAIGAGIDAVTERLANAAEETGPSKVIVAILTDGLENSSETWRRGQIFTRIEEKRSEGWEFIFLAANQDAMQEGKKLGIGSESTLNFETTGRGTLGAYEAMSDTVRLFRQTGKVDSVATGPNASFDRSDDKDGDTPDDAPADDDKDN